MGGVPGDLQGQGGVAQVVGGEEGEEGSGSVLEQLWARG